MTEGSDIYLGASIDQIYAQQVRSGNAAAFDSALHRRRRFASGACGYGYSCVYANTISWASPTQPLPMEIDPRMAFERLFGDGATPAERLARRADDRSILDTITQEVRASSEGSRRRATAAGLTDYLDDVREIERRIQQRRKIQRQQRSARAARSAGRRARFL